MKYIFVAHFACKSLLSLKIAVGSCQELLSVVGVLKLLVKFISVFASFFRLLITFYWRINFFVATTADFTYLANLQAHQKISNFRSCEFNQYIICAENNLRLRAVSFCTNFNSFLYKKRAGSC